ncbi:MAG: polysaccharide biosynthesis/export family protein [Planctomycetes bacterium]|nr:polysaccharide biosynthesis/export family protein [Planctomycetota bacterium]
MNLNMDFPVIAKWGSCILLMGLIASVLTGCVISDDARMLQLLNERGFGRKYSGNCNEVYYYGIDDSFNIKDEYNPELRGTFKIRMDGTVDFPELGETYVAGFTSQEIASMLNIRYGHYYKHVKVEVSPRKTSSKKFFIHLDTDRHMTKKFEGDQTLYDVIMSTKFSSIDVDLDNVKVIRSDPVHPLVIYCDMDAMIHHGDSRDNILIKEDDIIFFTPSIIGYFKQLVQTLVSPLQPVVSLFNAVNRIDRMADTFGDNRQQGGRYYGYY